ncbi:MAG: hypothetical protein ACKO4K_00605 [Flavobacteriales bacterium]
MKHYKRKAMKKGMIYLYLFVFSTISYAQSYKTAIGLKGGYPGYGSLNAKHFISATNALEASVGTGRFGLWLQGLYEWQHDLPTKGYEWYVGVGPNIGIQSSALSNGSTFYFSGSGLLGIEYTFDKIPLNIALDSGPVIQLLPVFGFGWGGGLAARYTLK